MIASTANNMSVRLYGLFLSLLRSYPSLDQKDLEDRSIAVLGEEESAAVDDEIITDFLTGADRSSWRNLFLRFVTLGSVSEVDEMVNFGRKLYEDKTLSDKEMLLVGNQLYSKFLHAIDSGEILNSETLVLLSNLYHDQMDGIKVDRSEILLALESE